MSKINWNTKGARLRLERIQQALEVQALNAHELSAALSMTLKWATHNLGELHRMTPKRVYIKEWRPWHSQTWLLACYAWGDQEDAPRPAYQQQVSQAKRIEAIRADPERREQYEARRRKSGKARSKEKRAADFQRWKENNPEAYAARLKKAAQATSRRRAKKRAEAAEKERAEAAAAKEAAVYRAMREARRHAKTIADEEARKRYLTVQQTILNPRPDPLVGLFFGIAA